MQSRAALREPAKLKKEGHDPWVAGPTVSARASNSIIAVSMHRWRSKRLVSRPLWSIAIRKRSQPIPKPPIRLYFEPLTAEDVIELAKVERSNGELCGAIVQLGGQTPLKLAAALADEGIAILGTSVDAIDLAEDRDRFKQLLDELGLETAGQCHLQRRK